MRSLRTRATAISRAVKKKVYERDEGCCVFCGVQVNEFFANAHFIPRSAGGLGVEENVLTLCTVCHARFDSTTQRSVMLVMFRAYLRSHYPQYDDAHIVYEKGWKK
jgi:5-methylcytosine-specific restriction endonuclease McrA